MSHMMQRAHEQYLEGVSTTIPEVTDTTFECFERAVRDFPDRVAIDFLGREYTYADVYKDVQRAVTVLALCGVRKGDAVALVMPNCPQHYVAFYAVQALGAIASEHNPLAPRDELLPQLEAVGARVVVAWEKTIEALARGGALMGYTFLAVNLAKALPRSSQMLLKLPFKPAMAQRDKLRGNVPPGVHSWDNQVSHNAPMNIASIPAPSADDVCVYIQTGGTTGTPKSVQITHKNLVSNATQVVEWLSNIERGTQTIGAVLPFFHAFGLQLSLSVCVHLAATQVMLPQFDVDMLFAAHRRHPITFFGGVPPMFERILDGFEALPSNKRPDLSRIRYGVSGAMALDPALAARWEEVTGGFLIEGYGMTEASPVISGSPLSAHRRASTLGLPFPSTEVKIVDPDDISCEMPEGEVGEILVRGPQVFKGYLNNPKETADTLTPDGFLRTGDLARWDDGFLVMSDRRKELIINGGFNIYPSEVEAALRDMPGVRDVAVIGMPAPGSRGEAVVAALVLEPGVTIDLASVRTWAEKKLAHYALPKSIAIMDELPRSIIGKTLRRNVRERIRTWELKSGEWKENLSAAVGAAAERADAIKEDLKDKADTLNERLRDRAETFKAKTNRQSGEPEKVSDASELSSNAQEIDSDQPEAMSDKPETQL